MSYTRSLLNTIYVKKQTKKKLKIGTNNTTYTQNKKCDTQMQIKNEG